MFIQLLLVGIKNLGYFVIYQFFQYVVTFWRNLQWPDPVDAYTIALRITDDMANAIETYADLVYKKLKDVGFFDDEGQFDVTEELCLALNNLQVRYRFTQYCYDDVCSSRGCIIYVILKNI